jgi:primosomal replication protein N
VNHCRLSGTLLARAALRWSPAGVPMLDAQIQCRSDVLESGLVRTLDFRIDAIGMGAVASELQHADLGSAVELEGFLAPRSRRSSRLVLHVTHCRAGKSPEESSVRGGLDQRGSERSGSGSRQG